MPPVPILPGTTVIKALGKIGYEAVRVSGSHHRLKHPDRRPLTVPVHSGDMRPGTLRSIIRDAGLTVEEFLELL
ncbi:type II toxin-antitoxin system HicA family toxin [Thermomonospora umbrina]|uniref:Putative RNA binding protein YcfA (HicA-like mRNA interferase family) n=1 Tax=Thermomonospora umbrina TaxID=111806 RepID=A0A3D9SPH5_9ACTN|nr:type II toxin-antitoxin system HicA family toxin [Thermomonospora umbrina]REE95863.1 putative RNA binding protein YcfA (HicA-like mRNA interferase family) [Thermomonospora umbrina]